MLSESNLCMYYILQTTPVLTKEYTHIVVQLCAAFHV